VDDNIAERTVGHAIPGVKGVYDRHAYFDEKGRPWPSWLSWCSRFQWAREGCPQEEKLGFIMKPIKRQP
jgi:hypothetical protein